jgi:hypothetical protein
MEKEKKQPIYFADPIYDLSKCTLLSQGAEAVSPPTPAVTNSESKKWQSKIQHFT